MPTTSPPRSLIAPHVLRSADGWRLGQLVHTALVLPAALEWCSQEPGHDRDGQLRRYKPGTQASDVRVVVGAGEMRRVEVVDGDRSDLRVAVGRDLHTGTRSAYQDAGVGLVGGQQADNVDCSVVVVDSASLVDTHVKDFVPGLATGGS